MLFSSSAVSVSRVSQFRGGLCFEPLEARRLLSVSQPVDLATSLVAEVETGDDTPVHFSLLAGPIVGSPTEGVSVEMVGARHLKPDLATDGTSSPATDAVTTEEIFAPQPVAVPPDESVDPFVDCPGLDEDFCLPHEIDLNPKIDTLTVTKDVSSNNGLQNLAWREFVWHAQGVPDPTI